MWGAALALRQLGALPQGGYKRRLCLPLCGRPHLPPQTPGFLLVVSLGWCHGLGQQQRRGALGGRAVQWGDRQQLRRLQGR